MRNITTLIQGFLGGLLLAGAALGSDAPSLDPIQGKWSNLATNRGEKIQFVLDIQKDKLVLEIRDAENQPQLAAKGNIKLEKAGPFDVMNVEVVESGRSLDDLRAADESRAFVFTVRGDHFFIVAGFDQERRNDPPRVQDFVRQAAAAAGPLDAAAVVGTWKVSVAIADATRDYELRLEQADGKLQGAMVSPRSGEHKVRLVTVKDNQLTMEWDREIDNNPVTFVFQGKLSGKDLAGSVNVKGHEEEYKGTWKATK